MTIGFSALYFVERVDAHDTSPAESHASAGPDETGLTLSRVTPHLIRGDWKRLAHAQAAALFDDFRRKASGPLRWVADDLARVRCIDSLSLPFYREGLMLSLEVETLGHEVAALDLVCGPQICHVVTGHSHWLSEKNADELLLNSADFCESLAPPDHIALHADYLRFHNGVVWGDLGSFSVVEHADDPLLDAARRRRSVGLPAIEPVVVRLTPDALWAAEASATVLYGGALFRAEFRMHRTGSIQMVDDGVLCDGLDSHWNARRPLRHLVSMD